MRFPSLTEASAKARRFLHLDSLPPIGRKILVGLAGGLVVVIGIAMVLLPGPAILFIPLGLAILALEFAWARKPLEKVRGWYERFRRRHRKKEKPAAR